MTNESPACCGCNVNLNWANDLQRQFIPSSNPIGLTESEKALLAKLATAWSDYMQMETKESNLHEFNDAIHRCQQLIALRVARRTDPEIWAS